MSTHPEYPIAKPRALRPFEHEWLDSIPDGVVVCDAGGRIIFANRQVEHLTGYRPQELRGKRVELLVPSRLRAVHRQHRKDYQVAGQRARFMGAAEQDLWVCRKDGSEFSAGISLGPVQSPEGLQTVAVIRDITERRRLEAELEHRALHDPLTDLPNRTLFFDRLQQAMLAGRREHKPFALVIVDLDRFKAVNDALGHAAGDLALIQCATRLISGLRRTDTVARLGGDEFACIMPRVSGRKSAERLVHKVLRPLQAAYLIDTHTVDVGVSAGVAIFPADGGDPDTLMRHADAAMYSAKRHGGGLAVYSARLWSA